MRGGAIGEADITIDVDALMRIVAQETHRDAASLTPDATLTSLGLSSIDLLSLVFSLEDRFGVVLDPEDLEEVHTLGDMITLVDRRAAGEPRREDGAR